MSGVEPGAAVPFLELRDIRKVYHTSDIPVDVLRGVTLDVRKSELVALVGASGSGKTTLMNLVGCLDRPTSGEYRMEGKQISELSRDGLAELRSSTIGFVFQNFNLLPRTSALENVLMPLSYSRRPPPREEALERANALLHRLGLAGREHHEPSQLSGGQQQRVAIARALVNRPALLCADEPTGNLDSATTQEVLEIFRQLHEEESVTIILVTHDAEVARHATRVVRMKDGKVVGEERGGRS